MFQYCVASIYSNYPCKWRLPTFLTWFILHFSLHINKTSMRGKYLKKQSNVKGKVEIFNELSVLCASHCMHCLLWLSNTSYFSYRLYLHVSCDCLWPAGFCNGVLVCFLWSGYLTLYTWSGFHASEFSLWYSLLVGIFTQYIGVSTITN